LFVGSTTNNYTYSPPVSV